MRRGRSSVARQVRNFTNTRKSTESPTSSPVAAEVGIYFDLYEVEPVEQYDSVMFMRAEFHEKLQSELVKVEFDAIKFAFDSKHLLDDVICERWHNGATASIPTLLVYVRNVKVVFVRLVCSLHLIGGLQLAGGDGAAVAGARGASAGTRPATTHRHAAVPREHRCAQGAAARARLARRGRRCNEGVRALRSASLHAPVERCSLLTFLPYQTIDRT